MGSTAKIEHVALKAIKRHADLQMRAGGLDEDHVEDLLRNLKAAGKLEGNEPVVFKVGSDYWLADGNHRYEAYERSGKKKMPCLVLTGSFEDAVEYALTQANIRNAKRYTNEDKRRRWQEARKHPKFRRLSQHKLADILGVTQPFGSKIDKELGIRPDNDYQVTGANVDASAVGPASRRTATTATAEAGSPVDSGGGGTAIGGAKKAVDGFVTLAKELIIVNPRLAESPDALAAEMGGVPQGVALDARGEITDDWLDAVAKLHAWADEDGDGGEDRDSVRAWAADDPPAAATKLASRFPPLTSADVLAFLSARWGIEAESEDEVDGDDGKPEANPPQPPPAPRNPLEAMIDGACGVVRPQAPPVPDTGIRDAKGRTVPESLVAVFAAGHRIKGICKEAEKLCKEAIRLRDETDDGLFFVTTANNARQAFADAISSHRPYVVCPSCDGERLDTRQKGGQPCPTCAGKGWVGQIEWGRMDPKLKAVASEWKEHEPDGAKADAYAGEQDDKGRPVPDHLLEAFAASKRLQGIVREVQTLAKEADRLREPVARELLARPHAKKIPPDKLPQVPYESSLKTHLDSFLGVLKSQRPVCVCPSCDGRGTDSDARDANLCPTCGGWGWVSWIRWDGLDPKLRAVASAWRGGNGGEGEAV